MANRLTAKGSPSRYDVSSVVQISIGGAAVKEQTQKALKRVFTNASVRQVYGDWKKIKNKKLTWIIIICYFYYFIILF